MKTLLIAQTAGPKPFLLSNPGRLALLLLFVLIARCAVALQTTNPAVATAGGVQTAPSQTATPMVVPGSVPYLVLLPSKTGGAYCGVDAGHTKPCRIGDTLFVGFSNLNAWMADSKNQLSDLTLVLNGRVMKGLVSRGPDTSYSGLQFDLKILDGTGPDHIDNRDTWNTLITELRSNTRMDVAVASGGIPPFSKTAQVEFQVFPSWTWAVLLFLAILVIAFIILAWKSDIVRDAPAVGNVKQSFSLARCQMAWWFFIAAASYCYIWLTLNNQDSLTQGVLILTGISAATALAATTIDSSKRDQRRKLMEEQTALNPRLAALPIVIAAAPLAGVADLQAELAAKTARLAAVATELAALPSPAGQSEGFLLDILRDETGISLHRFQMMGWTVILGFVFIADVYSHLTMPNFSPTLLGLMGISSGTYIGFKIPDPTK